MDREWSFSAAGSGAAEERSVRQQPPRVAAVVSIDPTSGLHRSRQCIGRFGLSKTFAELGKHVQLPVHQVGVQSVDFG